MKVKKALILITSAILLIALPCCSSSYRAKFQGENIILNEEEYVETNGYYQSEETTFCKVDGYKFYKIIGDENLNYFYIHSFTDNHLYVREGYKPTKNVITAVINDNLNHEYKDTEILEYFSSLSTIEKAVEEDKLENLADNHTVTIFLQYDNQPVCNELYNIIYDAKKDKYMIYNSFGFCCYVSDMYKDIVKKVYDGTE